MFFLYCTIILDPFLSMYFIQSYQIHRNYFDIYLVKIEKGNLRSEKKRRGGGLEAKGKASKQLGFIVSNGRNFRLH